MNRDDIIRMAREAGLTPDWLPDIAKPSMQHIERFADMSYQKGFEAGRAAEREACAQIAQGQRWNDNILLSSPPQSSAARNIETSIRARGTA